MAAVLPEVVRRYLALESPQEIAKHFGVHRNTIYNWMLAGAGDAEHHELVTAALVKRVATADSVLEEASDSVQVAKAREMCRFARMDLERRRPNLYGQKQLNVHVGEVTISAGRASSLLEKFEVEDAGEVK